MLPATRTLEKPRIFSHSAVQLSKISPPPKEFFPRARSYIDALPDGFASHRQCLTSPVYTRHVRDTAGSIVRAAPIPADLQALLFEDWPSNNVWISDVVATTFVLMLYDILHAKNRQKEFWALHEKAVEQLFKNPLMWAAMHVMSPKTMALNATKRWHLVHCGSEFAQTGGSHNTMAAHLSFPPKLFCELALQIASVSYEIALAKAGAKHVVSEVRNVTDVGANIVLKWD